MLHNTLYSGVEEDRLFRGILIFAGFYCESEGDLLGYPDSLCGSARVLNALRNETAVAAPAAFPYIFVKHHIRCTTGRTGHGVTSPLFSIAHGALLRNAEIFLKETGKPLDNALFLFGAVAAAKARNRRHQLVDVCAGGFQRTITERVCQKTAGLIRL